MAVLWLLVGRPGDAQTEHEIEMLRRQREEIAMLKEQLQQQVRAHSHNMAALSSGSTP